ncbi:glycosyl transferase family 4-domain-containing protein [Plectosphaerella plurivora]|uniref:UDP-N-acetylglucosamine--dolichyl-phosphate N-acetylglucosaminephosphotransferase n=1 Tax=Plectosphaerella plurivora TaxID=936078 RepID=A0A9P8VDD6_9PEZI|nr:glycosyl transferase family 4-domain-containing protein [Plectosphaerella plurivora]
MAPLPNTLSRNEVLALSAISFASLSLLANTFTGDDGAPLFASIALSFLAFSLCFAMIRWLGPTFVKVGLRGRDLSKTHRPEIPECMGAVCAAVYLLVIIVFIPFPFYKDIVAATSGGGNRDVVLQVEYVQKGRFLHRFPHNKLASYLSAIISLQTIAFLGIGDDLFDIRWRHKWWIPGLASVPILVVYFVDFGVTSIVIPIPLQPYLGELFDLKFAYYLYMACIAMFCPQSINMLAGINGIEVSQCLVVSLLLCLNDALYLMTPYPHPATDSHLFSLYLLLPWVGVSAALLLHNWYPARVFVGDTYCYFSGMVFAVVGILGHFSKTLGLLLVPQLFNFLYSTPQLFGLVPCPRHRMPRFNARTGLLEPSITPWSADRQPKAPVAIGLRLLAKLHLLDVKIDEETGLFVETSNFTLLNLWLVWRGPMREDRLAYEVTALQAFAGLFGLFVRHKLALLIFKEDNWAFSTATPAAAYGDALPAPVETVTETITRAFYDAAATSV